MIEVSYNQIKNDLDNWAKDWIEMNDYYLIFTQDMNFYHKLFKINKTDNSANPDCTDFENNYKSVWCELSFYSKGVNASNGDSVLDNSNYDVKDGDIYYYNFVLSTTKFIAGGYLYAKNVDIGDKVTFQIVLNMGGGSYYLVTEYMKDLKLFDGREIKVLMDKTQMKLLDLTTYPNLELRLKVETGRTDFQILLEYYFYKY